MRVPVAELLNIVLVGDVLAVDECVLCEVAV